MELQEASPPQWPGGTQARMPQALPAGGLGPSPFSACSHPPGRGGAGLTAQCLGAARVVGLGPAHTHEAGLAALRGRAVGLALHGGALHGH